jgi:hypothetical protein
MAPANVPASEPSFPQRREPSVLSLVIPAEAGTHFAFGLAGNNRIKMGPSFRWNDDQKKAANPP